MESFIRHTGLAAPLDRANIDTDQIIPKQFLKRIERTGFGQYLFDDWRRSADGEPDPGFVLNRDRYQGASILVAGRNFGCGSSREHAVWALYDYGFRAIIAPSFADIFHANCLSNGLLPVVLSEQEIAALLDRIGEQPGYKLTIDLERRQVFDDHGFASTFEMDPFLQHRLLHGLDDIALTLQHEDSIVEYERSMVEHGVASSA